MIRVVTKLPGEPAAVGHIVDDLPVLQRFVGGWLEAVMKGRGYFGNGLASLVVYGDEEAGLKDPSPPLNLYRPTDGCPLLGPLLAVKVDAEGDHQSMTEAEAARVIELLGTMRSA